MKKFFVSFPLALIITAGLTLLMVALIESGLKAPDKKKRTKLPEILMPDTSLEVQRVVEKPEKPEVDETPPPDIPEQDFDQIDGDSSVGAITAPGSVKADLDLDVGSGLSASDGEYLPIVKIAPQYPRRAQERGVEGYVVLSYTVTKQGTVKDPVVIEAVPNSVFNKAAIKAALRYKYKPRVEDGEPIAVRGVKTKITFKLGK